MITVNRFLVVWISAAKASKDSKNVTVVVLTISWVFAIWYSTLLGFPGISGLDKCLPLPTCRHRQAGIG